MPEVRIAFAKQLAINLQVIYQELTKELKSIEETSTGLYEKTLENNKDNILQGLEKYRGNLENIKQLNFEITEKINYWYEFIKDTREITHFLFPVKYYLKKTKIQKEIKRINKEIYNISIENRLLKENLLVWEQELEIKAGEELKQGEEYRIYEQLVRKKNQLISDLKYILPTLPDIYHIDLDLDNIEEFINQFLKNNLNTNSVE